MDAYWLGYLIVCVAALTQAVLATLQTFEHRRYCRSRVRNPNRHVPAGRVALIAPCRGLDPQLVDNLRPLFEQDHDNYELVFVVESAEDAACDTINGLIREYPHVYARVVVAGAASSSGQKVHNLLAATTCLNTDVEFLAFVDSDARPSRQWLRLLVQRLADPGIAASTAYRWFVPSQGLAAHLLASIDAAVTVLVGPSRHHLVWGGSWAIRRDAFEASNMRNAWRGTLSDDLIAARVLANKGMRVVFEPAAMVASPLNCNFRGMLQFVRRQFTIGRLYVPRFWTLGLALITFGQAVFWFSLLAALWAAVGKGSWGMAWGSLATGLYALHVARAWLRQDAARHFLPAHASQLASARRFDLWLSPVAGLVGWFGLVSSAFGRRIQWRGITYHVPARDAVRVIDREQSTNAGPPTHKLPESAEKPIVLKAG